MPSEKRTPLPSFSTELYHPEFPHAALIRTSAEGDLVFMLDRARKWSNELGFIPAEGMRKLVQEGRGLTLSFNGELAGYILTSGGLRRPLVVRHNTIEEDLWNHGLGEALMRAVLGWSRWSRRHYMLVRTRSDLTRQTAINKRMRGFILGSDEQIGKREHPVNIWSIPNVPTLFAST